MKTLGRTEAFAATTCRCLSKVKLYGCEQLVQSHIIKEVVRQRFKPGRLTGQLHL
jgi:hypothetical protein